MVKWGAMRLFLRGVGGLAVLSRLAFADTPAVVNGDFENPQIPAPFVSAVAVPGWIHNGAPGIGNLARVGYNDGFGEAAKAGDGQQVLLLGRGPAACVDAKWSTVIPVPKPR